MNKKELRKSMKKLYPYAESISIVRGGRNLFLSVQWRGGGCRVFYSAESVSDWLAEKARR